MEELIRQLIEQTGAISSKVEEVTKHLNQISHRLERLEKMDSIEHRVSVNQIDLSDIKGIVEGVAEFQRDELLELADLIKTSLKNPGVYGELDLIHHRLDAHLNKIAKNEEALLIIGNKNKLGVELKSYNP